MYIQYVLYIYRIISVCIYINMYRQIVICTCSLYHLYKSRYHYAIMCHQYSKKLPLEPRKILQPSYIKIKMMVPLYKLQASKILSASVEW